ncbi:MAG: nucleoside deaminase [Flavobacteriaceae bacterium]|nr:nucleoside deaminase [Flavobacteriaceae bacterium]MDZ4147105.1 nucleoside deaminase [Flavobacteriaceae bacterium]PKP40303.1 MAG: tRNA-specific adenosine deaminase [Bacteroidetes bacterium HGW-Bacteroidetes-13]
MIDLFTDEYFMTQALKEAKIAFDKGEVPVGAVVVINKKIIARAHNQTEMLSDVTAHAEILAITSAANYLGGKYLIDCTLYVTLEPCVMCAGALYWSQISRVVFAASDDKRGFRTHQIGLHPKTEFSSGLMEGEATSLLKTFFSQKRNF